MESIIRMHLRDFLLCRSTALATKKKWQALRSYHPLIVPLLIVPLSCCMNNASVTGPSLHLYPPQGKTAVQFQAEEKSCRAYAQQSLQSQENTPTSVVPHRQAQQSYDRYYGSCMLSLGNPLPPHSFWAPPEHQSVLSLPSLDLTSPEPTH